MKKQNKTKTRHSLRNVYVFLASCVDTEGCQTYTIQNKLRTNFENALTF